MRGPGELGAAKEPATALGAGGRLARWEEELDDCGKVLKYGSKPALFPAAGRGGRRVRAAAGAPEQPVMNEAPGGGGGDFSYNNSLLLGFHSLLAISV